MNIFVRRKLLEKISLFSKESSKKWEKMNKNTLNTQCKWKCIKFKLNSEWLTIEEMNRFWKDTQILDDREKL